MTEGTCEWMDHFYFIIIILFYEVTCYVYGVQSWTKGRAPWMRLRKLSKANKKGHISSRRNSKLFLQAFGRNSTSQERLLLMYSILRNNIPRCKFR